MGGADEVYGQDPGLRAELARRGLGYVLAIPKSHPVVTPGPLPACELARRLPARAWQRISAGPAPRVRAGMTCPTLVGYGNYGIAPVQNSTAIASRIRGAELRGNDGGHLFLFQDPAALPEFETFLQAPPRRRGSS